jgi:glycosyltransferase involved in cell wall biosynthesis
LSVAAMVRAAATLKARGFRFRMVLAGGANPTSSYREELAETCTRLQVDDLVELAGNLDDRRIDGLLATSAIAVQSSVSEGLSMALLEQMMAGLAIVATDVGDTGCAVRHGETGLLVRPRDDAGLTESIGRLLADDGLRRTLGAAARAHAVREFSLEAMSRRAVQVYASIGRS